MRVWLKQPCIGSDEIYSANEGRKGQGELVACGRMISYPFSREECKHFTSIGHFNFFLRKRKIILCFNQWFSNFQCTAELLGRFVKYILLGSIPELLLWWQMHIKAFKDIGCK